MSHNSVNPDYHSLLKGALVELKKMRAELDSAERAKTEPIAIVGMGCRFPGGVNNPETYWQLLHNGVDAITEIPSDRWDVDAYYDRNKEVPGKMYTRYGAFIDDVDRFDPQFFEISPREAMSMDPQQRLLLEVTWEALENGGIAPQSLRGSQTGVFMGVCFDDYAKFNVKSVDTTRIDAYDALGNFRSVAAGRISYFLGLHGPTMQLDTTCSSALLGVHLACQSLRNRESNIALAGGVNLMLEPGTTVGFSKLKALSPDGRCKTFDATANGYARGEGCGVVVLKRLSDAIADGDLIHGLVRGSAANHDGRSNGLTAPNGSAQEALLHQALNNAKVKPHQIQYVEAHGTGTSLGDPIEVSALGRVLGQGRSKDNPLTIGSVKTNFGHTETAAGVAGLIKVVLSLQNRQIPPHLHFKEPNPFISWQKFSLVVPTKLTPWQARDDGRFAGVSSFGMSGTNVHAIIEQAPEPNFVHSEVKLTERSHHLLSLSAKSKEALHSLVNRYQQFLESHPKISLADICFTANTGRDRFEHRLSVVTESKAQLAEQLKAFSNGAKTTGVANGSLTNNQSPKIAFLFTGQGSQYAGMGRQLFETQPVFRATLFRCDAILRPYLDKPLLKLLYSELDRTSLNETAYTQPSLFAFEYALAELWQSWGIKPDVVMGHSLGEYVAATIAGVFSLEDALKLIVHRANLMQALPSNGEMVAIFAGEELVKDCLNFDGEVAIAGLNSPENTVISGRHHAIAKVLAALEDRGIEYRKLNVSHAFHSPLMEPMLADFEQVASEVSYSKPQIDIVSNVTGELVTEEIATPQYWCRHIRQPVKFTASLATLDREGYELFLEIGAKPTLLGMGRQCLTDDNKVWLPSLRWGREDWQQMLESLGELYVRGVSVDWVGFDRDYPRHKVVLPTYPFQHKRYWVEAATHPEQYLLSTSDLLHPLLGRQLRLPFSQEIRFETQFSSNSPSFMKDHKLFGITVVPAAAYVATALSAVKEALGTESCVLEDLFFPQALVLPENSSQTVQVLLNREETALYSFQIISLGEGQDENQTNSWKLHGTGKVRLTETRTELKEAIDLSAVPEQSQQNLSQEEFYQPIWDFGYTLGSLFQWNHQVWRQEGEAWCQLKMPSELVGKDISSYQLYPGLIDSCLQLLVNLLQDNAAEASENQEIYLPFIIEKFKFYQPPHTNRQLWCQAKSRDSQNGSAGKLWGDIRILDETGVVIAEIEGFELRKASQELLQQELHPNKDSLLYKLVWKPQERKPANLSANAEISGNWLIFADRGGTGQQIAEQLSEYGIGCTLVYADSVNNVSSDPHYAIDPTNPKDFLQLFQHEYQGIVHLWSLDDSIWDPTGIDLQKARELGCASVLHLIQALLEHHDTQLPRLCLITKGAMSVDRTPQRVNSTPPLKDGETCVHFVNVGQASLWGLGKVIALEHPDLKRLLIDIDPANEAESIPALVEEILSPDKEDQIALRQGLRYVARLTNVTEFTDDRLQMDANGSYLITGGLGALGIKVANWLAARGVGNLILIGRRDASAQAQKAIAQLESSGVKVLVTSADVSNFEELAQTFKVIEAQMPPLRGVIHAAGVLDDGLILRQNWSSFERVMAPKVAGSWNLHRLTQELPLDFFVCFSSVASLIGSPGQGNYAAANAFMDALCHHRRSLNLPGSSINWGPWAGEGMAANAPEQWQQLLAGWGFKSLAAERGLEALKQILHHQLVQIGVVSIDWSKFIGQFSVGAESPIFSEVVTPISQPEKSVESKQKLQLLQQLQKMSSDRRQKLLIDYIREQLGSVLKLDPTEKLNPQQGFFEMGIDSLMTIELKNRVEVDLGCSLPSTLFFKYPTLESLAEYLVNRLIQSDVSQVPAIEPPVEEEVMLTNTVDDVEQLSEAEAEALLLAKIENF